MTRLLTAAPRRTNSPAKANGMLAKQLKKVTEERDLARQTIRDLYRRIREYQQAAHGEIDFA